MATILQGNPYNLQGNSQNLQGGNTATALQPAGNPQQVYGPLPPVSTTQKTSVASSPTVYFYKPDPNSQQVYDSNGNPLSYAQYIAAGGKG